MKTYPLFKELLKEHEVKTKDLEILLKKSKNIILRLKKDPSAFNIKDINVIAELLKINVYELFLIINTEFLRRQAIDKGREFFKNQNV